jgi:hypothetical protein
MTFTMSRIDSTPSSERSSTASPSRGSYVVSMPMPRTALPSSTVRWLTPA